MRWIVRKLQQTGAVAVDRKNIHLPVTLIHKTDGRRTESSNPCCGIFYSLEPVGEHAAVGPGAPSLGKLGALRWIRRAHSGEAAIARVNNVLSITRPGWERIPFPRVI